MPTNYSKLAVSVALVISFRATVGRAQLIETLEVDSTAMQQAVLLSTFRLDSGCTAFAIDYDRRTSTVTVLTACHCVEFGQTVILESFDVSHWPDATMTYSGRVVMCDDEHDIAVIQFESESRVPTLRLRHATPSTFPAKCFAIGCPRGESPSVVSRQVVSKDVRTGELVTDSGGIGGQSGSPLLYEAEVIGIHLRSNKTSKTWFADLQRMRSLTNKVLPERSQLPRPSIPLRTYMLVVVKLAVVTSIANQRWRQP